MESMLIRERYKVVRVLWTQPDYALVEAVDIQERETPTCLINLYEGGLMHRYGRLCGRIRQEDCPALREAFLENGTLAVVFDDARGESIDAAFYRGDRWKWQDRLEFAGLVMYQALLLANLPPEISCAVLLSDNLLVDTAERKVRLRYMLRPMGEMTAREPALLACDQLRKILPWQFSAGKAEQAFRRRLERGDFPSIVPMYSAWRQAEADIRAEREKFRKANPVRRGFTMLWRGIRRLWERGRQL